MNTIKNMEKKVESIREFLKIRGHLLYVNYEERYMGLPWVKSMISIYRDRKRCFVIHFRKEFFLENKETQIKIIIHELTHLKYPDMDEYSKEFKMQEKNFFQKLKQQEVKNG